MLALVPKLLGLCLYGSQYVEELSAGDAQRGPERRREAVCTYLFVYIAAVSELHWMGTAV